MQEYRPDAIYREQTAELYDAISTGLDGDVRFYVDEAKQAGAPVLEIGCGTGRILIPISEAGVEVVGLDAAPSMLAIAERKVAQLPEQTRNRITLVEGDMRRFDLGRRFPLILIPYRAFLHMLTMEDQKLALARIHAHLTDGGRLVFNVFDPRLEAITAYFGPSGTALHKLEEFAHPQTGNRMVLWDTRHYDCERQVLTEDRLLEELDAQGQVVSKRYSTLTLRFVYRYEMQHLLDLCGFAVEALHGDFHRGPFRYGGEQVWIVRKK